MTVFVGNTNLVELIGLKDAVGDFINDADAEVTIKDLDGAALTGETWPKAMDYVADSDGDYRTTVAATVVMVARQYYKAHIDATSGTDIGHWEFLFRAQTRTR